MTGARILIVDDDTALLQALPEALRLRMPGVTVETSDSALQALERVAACDYDAIVSDIKMPGMDGLTFLKHIRELRPTTPTLLITGHGEHDLAIQALRGGAYDFIQKPIDRDYFVASLSRAIQMRQLSREVEEQRHTLERHAAELERAVMERTRELVEANLEKDEMLRVREDFLSIASHELKTPLTSLKGLAQMARRRLEQAQIAEARYVIKMERAIDRMEALVNDLLDVSRIESGKLNLRLERCDLVELCQHLIDEQLAASEANAQRVIALESSDGSMELNIDVDRLSQVLSNLLSNALKYSTIEKPIVLSILEHDDEVVVSIRDQGPGIPSEELPHVFDRFYRVPGIDVQSGSGVGLGLGLYITHEIIERHGGRIWAESQVGQGSVFSFALPTALVGAKATTPHQGNTATDN